MPGTARTRCPAAPGRREPGGAPRPSSRTSPTRGRCPPTRGGWWRESGSCPCCVFLACPSRSLRAAPPVVLTGRPVGEAGGFAYGPSLLDQFVGAVAAFLELALPDELVPDRLRVLVGRRDGDHVGPPAAGGRAAAQLRLLVEPRQLEPFLERLQGPLQFLLRRRTGGRRFVGHESLLAANSA